jgi:hypothetical protein
MGIGILAFGSIAEDTGSALAAAVTRRIQVHTPFAVEFARSSRTRDGAPTLVPVRQSGAHVPATVLILDDSVTIADARAMLYRRETGRLNNRNAGSRAAWIAELPGFAGTNTCLYTALRSNIRPLTHLQGNVDPGLGCCRGQAFGIAEQQVGRADLDQQRREPRQ